MHKNLTLITRARQMQDQVESLELIRKKPSKSKRRNQEIKEYLAKEKRIEEKKRQKDQAKWQPNEDDVRETEDIRLSWSSVKVSDKNEEEEHQGEGVESRIDTGQKGESKMSEEQEEEEEEEEEKERIKGKKGKTEKEEEEGSKFKNKIAEELKRAFDEIRIPFCIEWDKNEFLMEWNKSKKRVQLQLDSQTIKSCTVESISKNNSGLLLKFEWNTTRREPEGPDNATPWVVQIGQLEILYLIVYKQAGNIYFTPGGVETLQPLEKNLKRLIKREDVHPSRRREIAYVSGIGNIACIDANGAPDNRFYRNHFTDSKNGFIVDFTGFFDKKLNVWIRNIVSPFSFFIIMKILIFHHLEVSFPYFPLCG